MLIIMFYKTITFVIIAIIPTRYRMRHKFLMNIMLSIIGQKEHSDYNIAHYNA